MKSPTIYNLEYLVRANFNYSVTKKINGKWVMARPLSTGYLTDRFKCAWLAFTGKCDLVKWPEGQ